MAGSCHRRVPVFDLLVLMLVLDRYFILYSESSFVLPTTFVESFGAVGVWIKWLSILDYMRAFHATGPLIRMIETIICDVTPFLVVLLIVCSGSVLFFVINVPTNPLFDVGHETLGAMQPAITIIRFAMGDLPQLSRLFDSEINSFSYTMVLVYGLFVLINMMNLLIAIMGNSYGRIKQSEFVEVRADASLISVESYL